MKNVKDQIYEKLLTVTDNVSDVYPKDWSNFPVIQYTEEDNSVYERTATRSSAIGGKRFLKPSDEKRKPHDRRKKNWKRHGRRSNATSRAAPTPSTGLTPDNAGVITVPCSSAAS